MPLTRVLRLKETSLTNSQPLYRNWRHDLLKLKSTNKGKVLERSELLIKRLPKLGRKERAKRIYQKKVCELWNKIGQNSYGIGKNESLPKFWDFHKQYECLFPFEN